LFCNQHPTFHGETLGHVLLSECNTRKRLGHMYGIIQMAPANHVKSMAALESVPTAWITIVAVDPTPH